MINILIADQHALMRSGIRRMLRDESDLTVVAEAGRIEQVLATIRLGKVDVLLMDCRELDLPGGPYEYFLEHAKVALSDGAPFGEVGKDCVRLNFATPRTLLEQILERLADSIAK